MKNNDRDKRIIEDFFKCFDSNSFKLDQPGHPDWIEDQGVRSLIDLLLKSKEKYKRISGVVLTRICCNKKPVFILSYDAIKEFVKEADYIEQSSVSDDVLAKVFVHLKGSSGNRIISELYSSQRGESKKSSRSALYRIEFPYIREYIGEDEERERQLIAAYEESNEIRKGHLKVVNNDEYEDCKPARCLGRKGVKYVDPPETHSKEEDQVTSETTEGSSLNEVLAKYKLI